MNKIIKQISSIILISFMATNVIPLPAYAEWARLHHRFELGKKDRIYTDGTFQTELFFEKDGKRILEGDITIEVFPLSRSCLAIKDIANLNKEGAYVFRFKTSNTAEDVRLSYVFRTDKVRNQAFTADAKVIDKGKYDKARGVTVAVGLPLLLASGGKLAYSDPYLETYATAVPQDSFKDMYISDGKGAAYGLELDHKFISSDPNRIYVNDEFKVQMYLSYKKGDPIISDLISIEAYAPNKAFTLKKKKAKPDENGLYSFDLRSANELEVDKMLYKISFPDGTVKYVAVKFRVTERDVGNYLYSISGLCLSIGIVMLPLTLFAGLGGQTVLSNWVSALCGFLGTGIVLLVPAYLIHNAYGSSYSNFDDYEEEPEPGGDNIDTREMKFKLVDHYKDIKTSVPVMQSESDKKMPKAFRENAMNLTFVSQNGYQVGYQYHFSKYLAMQTGVSYFKPGEKMEITAYDILMTGRMCTGWDCYPYISAGPSLLLLNEEIKHDGVIENVHETYVSYTFKAGLEYLLSDNFSCYLAGRMDFLPGRQLSAGEFGFRMYGLPIQM